MATPLPGRRLIRTPSDPKAVLTGTEGATAAAAAPALRFRRPLFVGTSVADPTEEEEEEDDDEFDEENDAASVAAIESAGLRIAHFPSAVDDDEDVANVKG